MAPRQRGLQGARQALGSSGYNHERQLNHFGKGGEGFIRWDCSQRHGVQAVACNLFATADLRMTVRGESFLCVNMCLHGRMQMHVVSWMHGIVMAGFGRDMRVSPMNQAVGEVN